MAVTPPVRERTRLFIGIQVAAGVVVFAIVASFFLAMATGEASPNSWWVTSFVLIACFSFVALVLQGIILATRPRAFGARFLHSLGRTRQHVRLLGVSLMWAGCVGIAVSLLVAVQLATSATFAYPLDLYPFALVVGELLAVGPVFTVRVWSARGPEVGHDRPER